MSLPRLIHSTIFSKMSVGYALKRNGCPFLDCSSMVFYRAIPSILIYIYVYSTRSFYRSLASNSLRISWELVLSENAFHLIVGPLTLILTFLALTSRNVTFQKELRNQASTG